MPVLVIYLVGRCAEGPRPTTCSHSNWLVNALSPMMCVTVLGVPKPSESIPTEMTFCICSPGCPGRPHGIDHPPELLGPLVCGEPRSDHSIVRFVFIVPP